jgi:regulator of PEP synthase PpsR (kinase-PPPase family)
MREPSRPVFFVSDGTGITAETLGSTLLTQFESVSFKKTTLPFVNTTDKARSTVEYIDYVGSQGLRPIIVSTTVNDDVRAILRTTKALFLDLFDTYIHQVEAELGVQSTHAQGRAHGRGDLRRYDARIEAMNFAMEHDDGQSMRDLSKAQVILIAPSRCGKTPTSLYLALQHGIFATNFPLTDEDLENTKLPRALDKLADRCFGLTSEPERLSQVRTERRAGSKYASLAQCAYELRQAESLYRKYNVPFVSSANMSIEEIATMVIQEKGLQRSQEE